MRFSSITAIGDFTALNGTASDYLSLEPGRCSDSRTLRTSVEDAPGADGVLVYPALNGARIITVGGPIVITSAGDETGYLNAIDTIEGSLESALDAMKSTPDALVHSAGSFNVWTYSWPSYSWDGAVRIVTFSLIEA